MASPSAATSGESAAAPLQPLIQWYPGHIAKAEQALTASLDKVDLVLEVRDARIPLATSHPRLDRWLKGKPHLLVLNRMDMVPPAARQTWTDWFRQQQLTPLWCDAKAGLGVKGVQKAAIRAGEALNARRLGRGMRPRAVRALVLGFPNVGKSALINRLVGQRVVESARRPGVTRSLRWVRLGQELDLLDAPGVLPPQLEDQRAALLLAICDDIGQAAYDTELVGLGFLRRLLALEEEPAAGVELARLESRYKVELAPTAPGEDWDPEAWLTLAATRHTSGDRVRMAQRLLDDFRKGLLGPMGLEAPPSPMTGSDNHAPPSVAPSCCSFTGEDSGGMDDDLRRSSAT